MVLSEPAIQLRRKSKGKQIWALEKMENRLVDMRELYQEWKDFDEDNPVSERDYNEGFYSAFNVSTCHFTSVGISRLAFRVCHFASPIGQKGHGMRKGNKEYGDKTFVRMRSS